MPTILGELRRHCRDRTWALRIPRSHQALSLKIEQARDDLATSLGRHPTVAELSRRLGLDEALALHLVTRSFARHAEATFVLERSSKLHPTCRPVGR